MKIKQKLIVSGLVATGVLTACVANNNGYSQNSNRQGGYNSAPINSSATHATTINSKVKHSLAYMYEEERLAKEVYLAIYDKQPVRQLSKIASGAEVRHIDAVKKLATRYGVATPYQQAGRYNIASIQSLYNDLYAKGIRSRKDALEVGCMVEVVDINDLNNYIGEAEQANAQDVLQTYDFLRKGSYNHYWAFDRGLKQLGVSDGCCSLGQTYCHPEYPKKERGQGHGGGQGRGHGQGGGWR